MLLAVLLTLAAPTYRNVVAHNRATAQLDQLIGAINFARNAAVYHHVIVTLCPSSDKNTCDANWQKGWLVFLDPQALGKIDSNSRILRSYSAISSTDKLEWRGLRTNRYLQLDPIGSTHGQVGTFIYCTKGNRIVKTVIVSQTGRIRSADERNPTNQPLVCN